MPGQWFLYHWVSLVQKALTCHLHEMLGGPNTARHWMGQSPHSVLSPHWRRWVSLFIKISILPGLLPHPQPLSPHFFSCSEHGWHQWLLSVFEGERHQGCAWPTMPRGLSFWGALSQAQQQEVSSLHPQPYLLDHLVSLAFSCSPTLPHQPAPCLASSTQVDSVQSLQGEAMPCLNWPISFSTYQSATSQHCQEDPWIVFLFFKGLTIHSYVREIKSWQEDFGCVYNILFLKKKRSLP